MKRMIFQSLLMTVYHVNAMAFDLAYTLLARSYFND